MIGKDDGWRIFVEPSCYNCCGPAEFLKGCWHIKDGLPYIPRVGEMLSIEEEGSDYIDEYNPCKGCEWECSEPERRLGYAEDLTTVVNVVTYCESKIILITLQA